jgi:hypothetical protein
MTCLALHCLLTLSNVYLTGTLSTPINGDHGPARVCHGRWCRGPLAEARIGYEIPLSSQVTIDVGVRHTSFPKDNDRGEESGYLSFTWRPFKGR